MKFSMVSIGNEKPAPGQKAMAAILSLALVLTMTPARAGNGIQIQNGQKLAFMGDSITANGWILPGGYVKLVVDALEKEGIKVEPIPAGVSGNTSKDMLARLDKDILSKHPDWMTLSCGVNDVWHGVNGVDLETYKKNITSIVDQATAQGIKMVILTATPIGEDDNANNQKLVAYNEFLRQLAKERNLPLADLNADFQAALQKTPTTPQSRNLTVDGVHMNPEGNILMARGCLRAFGVSTAEMDKIEQAWLTQPDTAMVPCGNFDPRPNGLGITLGQFREIEKIAQARNTDFEQLDLTLLLQALGEVLQTHAQDSLIDPEQVKKETTARFGEKIQELLKTSPPNPKP